MQMIVPSGRKQKPRLKLSERDSDKLIFAIHVCRTASSIDPAKASIAAEFLEMLITMSDEPPADEPAASDADGKPFLPDNGSDTHGESDPSHG